MYTSIFRKGTSTAWVFSASCCQMDQLCCHSLEKTARRQASRRHPSAIMRMLPRFPNQVFIYQQKRPRNMGKCQWLCRTISFAIFEQNKHMMIIDNMCMIDGSFRVDGRAMHFCCHWLRKLASNFRIIPIDPQILVHWHTPRLLSCKGCKWNLASTSRYRVVHNPYAPSTESLTKSTHMKVLQMLAYLPPMYHPSTSCFRLTVAGWSQRTEVWKLAGEKNTKKNTSLKIPVFCNNPVNETYHVWNESSMKRSWWLLIFSGP